MTELHRAVDSAMKSGKRLEDVVSGSAPAKTTITLPPAVKNWTGKSLPGQGKDTWEEIAQKKPRGEIQQ